MAQTIVVVEDDLDCAMLLVDNLARRGLHVHAVHSSQECLDWARVHPIDIVITAVKMAGMSGIELCAVLRELYPRALVIVLTGQTGAETASAAFRAGAYDFIIKPVKVDAVVRTIARALAHIERRDEPVARGPLEGEVAR